VKTDQRDAQVLSEVSCRVDLPSVHIPKPHSREMRSVCTWLEALVAARTQLINSVRSYLRTHLGRIRRGSTATLPERVRHRAASSRALLPAHIRPRREHQRQQAASHGHHQGRLAGSASCAGAGRLGLLAVPHRQSDGPLGDSARRPPTDLLLCLEHE
jgi:transposase